METKMETEMVRGWVVEINFADDASERPEVIREAVSNLLAHSFPKFVGNVSLDSTVIVREIDDEVVG